MSLKIAVTLCMVALASAQYGHAPSYGGNKYAEPEPYDSHPQYNFEYAVNDPATYDVKSQKESRDGDNVYGVYELVEPDGTRRVVEYQDTGYGFQATVHRTPAQGGYNSPAYAAKPSYAKPSYAKPSYSAVRPSY